ncbi:MAG: ATP-binding protein [Candidatus Phosphoribacter sp.]|nr:HAMP domain-containing histidine kinase [Actinomycetales bacterium]
MTGGTRAGFGGRLLAAHAAVLTVTVLTTAVVAWLVGPALFHDHLAQAGHALDAEGVMHVEQAYADTTIRALGLAFALALACSAALSWSLARRLRRTVHELGAAAGEMAGGDYGARVHATGAARELDVLADSFNEMAGRLEHVEDTRRRLLADLAHELRTPIATLAGYLDGIEDGVVPWNEPTRAVLADQTTRLRRLADDLEAVSRAEEGRIGLHLAPVRLAEVLDNARSAAAERYAAKGVRLVVEARPGAEGAQIVADSERLGQVVANLLANSLRHTATAGTVTLAATTEGRQARIVVTDLGEGIAAEHLPHVFERFYRADPSREHRDSGSGIGLTISKGIVEAHGGTIRAESAGLGHGSTVTVTLPIDGFRPGAPHQETP